MNSTELCGQFDAHKGPVSRPKLDSVWPADYQLIDQLSILEQKMGQINKLRRKSTLNSPHFEVDSEF